jgi:beta-lactamase regulating signal transducer with metallopeptidase domain
VSALLLVLLVESIKASLILLLAALVTWLLRGQSATLRHTVWAAALFGTLLLPLATATLPVLQVWTLPGSLWPSGDPAAVFLRSSPAYKAIPGELYQSGSHPALRPTHGSSAWLPLMLVLIWLGGGVWVAARTALAHARVRSLLRRATRIGTGRLPSIARELSPGERPVSLFESSDISTPATVGVWLPAILLPTEARRWPPAETRAILAHELAHVHRWDCLTQAISRVACAVYWFNPLVWLADRRMSSERERACDDAALRAGAAPVDYAAMLLDLVRSVSSRSLAPGALPMVGTSELEARLRAILDPGLPRGTLRPSTWSMVLGLAGGMVLLSGSVGLTSDRATMPSASTASALEPDLLGDSLSHALSERLPRIDIGYALSRSREAAAGPDSALVQVLRRALNRISRGPGDLVRERSIWALSLVEQGHLVEPLIRRLTDRDWRVICYAAWTLAQARDRRAVTPLIDLLESANWRVRAMASFALAAIGDPRSQAAMRDALRDEAWQVRINAVEFVGLFDDRESKAAVVAGLKDRHSAVRGAAELALRR